MTNYPFHIMLGRFFSRRRYILYIPFALICLLWLCFWKKTEKEIMIWSISMGLMAVGLLIRLWSVRHCGKRTMYKGEKGRWLTVHGPYIYVRNPMYIGNLVLGCALIVLSGLFWLVPVFVIGGFLFYHLVVLYEETRLLAYYGSDYETYRKNVGRWLPRFSSSTVVSTSTEVKLNPWSEIFRAEGLRFLAVVGMIILLRFNDLNRIISQIRHFIT